MIEAVLDFWFGERARGRWFAAEAAFDTEVREKLGELAREAASGALDHWQDSPLGSLALVILLDQAPRNIHRGQPAAFASDAHARAVADRAIALGHDRQLDAEQRVFIYLPFEHSEQLADQERSLRLFTALGNAEQLDYAVRHHEIIARFGRFPHRNAVLRRRSNLDEQAFLTQPGSAF